MIWNIIRARIFLMCLQIMRIACSEYLYFAPHNLSFPAFMFSMNVIYFLIRCILINMLQFIFQSFIFLFSVESVYCNYELNLICIWYVRITQISHSLTNQFEWINPSKSFSHWGRNISESVVRHVPCQNSNDRRST